jgi:hypothetical protein
MLISQEQFSSPNKSRKLIILSLENQRDFEIHCC